MADQSKLNGDRFLVTNIQRYSVNDGPGIRTTVFLKGCPLSCAWCHNPESIRPIQEFFFNEEKCIRCGRCAAVCPAEAVTAPIRRRRPGRTGPPKVAFDPVTKETILEASDVDDIVEVDPPKFDRNQCAHCLACVENCPSGALYLSSRPMTVDEVYEEVVRDRIFYDASGGGMTLSGGEPLLHPQISLALLQKAKQDGLHTALDTTGFARWEIIEEVLEYVDLVLFDVKTLSDLKHRKWTGVSNRPILENLKKMASLNVDIRIRSIVIHNVNYWDLDHPREVVELAKSLGDRVVGIDLIPYHNFAESKYERLGRKYAFSGFPNLFPEDVEEYRKIMDESGPWTPTVGGLIGSPETEADPFGSRSENAGGRYEIHDQPRRSVQGRI